MQAILSINPVHVEKIFNGTKKFEFRKSDFKNGISRVIIYSTKPIGKVVGYFDVEDVITDDPHIIWELTCDDAGIEREFFFNYYKNKKKANAIKIAQVKKYDQPIEVLSKGFKPPQSYMYATDEFLNKYNIPK